MLMEKGTDKAVYTLRVHVDDGEEHLGNLFLAIGQMGASVGDIHRVGQNMTGTTRDIDVLVDDQAHLDSLLEMVGRIDGARIHRVDNHVETLHEGGKIKMISRHAMHNISDVRKLYTPGVAYICRRIHAEPELMHKYTYVDDTVAIVTNGTAVLGLGDIGPRAGMPVMEGKALLFSSLAGVNGIPILIDSKDPDVIVSTVASIGHSFGAIQLEDIAAPECFEIENRLQEMMDIPVMHDDQHGTAVVVLASLINACKYTGTMQSSATVGIIGLGAAGIGIAKLLRAYGVGKILGTDIVPEAQERLRQMVDGEPVSLDELMAQADIVIATTGVAGLIKPEAVRRRQVIFALSNPNPEIKPEEALERGAAFAADGRMVNNALAFPGLFRGALSARAHVINDDMKIAAAEAIAAEAAEGDLVPMLLKEGLHQRVADRVERCALESGANR